MHCFYGQGQLLLLLLLSNIYTGYKEHFSKKKNTAINVCPVQYNMQYNTS